MGFRYRKQIKIVPGVKLNVTKNGFSSISVGKRGSSININKQGTKATVGIPNSGMSYSTKRRKTTNNQLPKNYDYANVVMLEQILGQKEHCINILSISGIELAPELTKKYFWQGKKRKQLNQLNFLVKQSIVTKVTNQQMIIQVEQILRKYNLIRFAKANNFNCNNLSEYQSALIVYIDANNHLSQKYRKQLISGTIIELGKEQYQLSN